MSGAAREVYDGPWNMWCMRSVGAQESLRDGERAHGIELLAFPVFIDIDVDQQPSAHETSGVVDQDVWHGVEVRDNGVHGGLDFFGRGDICSGDEDIGLIIDLLDFGSSLSQGGLIAAKEGDAFDMCLSEGYGNCLPNASSGSSDQDNLAEAIQGGLRRVDGWVLIMVVGLGKGRVWL